MTIFRKSIISIGLMFTIFFGSIIVANAAAINFHPNGGSTVTNTHNNKYNTSNNQTVELSSFTTEREGYTFIGWYSDSDFSGSALTSVVVLGNIELYAKWETEKHTLTFETNGGEELEPLEKEYNETVDLSNYSTTKNGYEFKGWYSDSSLTEEITSWTAVNDQVVYAKWDPIVYTIEYDLDGGEATNKETYTVEDDDFELENPVKEGYEFIGWTGSNGDTPEDSVTVVTSSMENKTYKANYLKKVHLIVRYLDSSDNSISDEETIDYLENDEYQAPEALEIEGYILDDSRLPRTSGEFADEDIYVDYYYIRLFTVTFDSDGGTDVDDITDIEENTELDLSEYTTTKDGYNFLGWYDEEGNEVTSLIVDADRTLTAKWEEIPVENEEQTKETGSTVYTEISNDDNPPTKDGITKWLIALVISLLSIVVINKKEIRN